MSEIYGFYIPSKACTEVFGIIKNSLQEFSKGSFRCELRNRNRDDSSMLVQISVSKDINSPEAQLVRNIAKTLSYQSKLPWLEGMLQSSDYDVVWDATVPEHLYFNWSRRRYEKKMDKACLLFGHVLELILNVYDNNRQKVT